MRVMGVDSSTHTGIAVVDSGKKIVYTEEVHFKKLTGFERVSAIAARVSELHGEYHPDLVVIENYGFANAHTLVPLVEIGTVIRYFLWQEGHVFLVVPPNSLKKFLGRGNLPKEMVRIECYKQHGFEHESNNVVDAYVLALLGLGVAGEYPLYSYQMDAIKSVKDLRDNKLWQPKLRKEV